MKTLKLIKRPLRLRNFNTLQASTLGFNPRVKFNFGTATISHEDLIHPGHERQDLQTPQEEPEDRIRTLESYGELPLPNIEQDMSLFYPEDKDVVLTSTEKIHAFLQIDKDTAYNDYAMKIQETFNNELDMYGDIQEAGELDLQVLRYGNPVPLHKIHDEGYMGYIRTLRTFNQDIPGSIELVHPNRFITDLRTIEEMRHTPVVPISEIEMKRFNRKVQDRHRQGFYFEIKKDTLYFYGLAVGICGAIFYVIILLHDMDEEAQRKELRSRIDLKEGMAK
eukprot:CAMPEP_0114971812 /NCGR_PEP_ID=MMETSP0216-20121206/52_1 /TAXON_ID=223996 /ORGANISM="Protocruzia adherens, Strain Boccale" /LENGTH=278 /DNA_ID=CAMNT_0002332125 /DNA_START=1046 /DNA_END=1882 /DNA_ORIENTATION=+